jgi:glutathione S-transferase
MLTLYQAEWCPYSSAVRQRLTELGLDFVARQVEPRAADRRAVTEIPTLEVEGGVRLEGTDPIFEYLATLEPWEHEHAHRAQYRAHAAERRDEKTAHILADKAPLRMGR